VKQSLRDRVEFSIDVDKIIKPIIPQTTLDIIKEQTKKQEINLTQNSGGEGCERQYQ